METTRPSERRTPPPVSTADLDALPEFTVVVDGSGLAKQKHDGKWKAWFDRDGSSSARMLNPDVVTQPVTIIWVPTGRACARCGALGHVGNPIGLTLCSECSHALFTGQGDA